MDKGVALLIIFLTTILFIGYVIQKSLIRSQGASKMFVDYD